MAAYDDPPSDSSFGPRDPRSCEERLVDLRKIHEQVDNINHRQNDITVRNNLVRQLQARRAPENRRNRRDALGLARFEAEPDARGDVALVAQGELLIRAEAVSKRRVQSLIKTYRLSEQPVECLDNRLVRLLVPAEVRGAQLVELAGALRGQGANVSVNYALPMGVVAKGLGGPERSVASQRPSRQAPGPGTPIRVAVIDTGIPEKERADGWLTGLVRENNIDLLDELPTPNGFLDFGAGHGTFVAGVIQQVAPGAEISVYRALDSDGIGEQVRVACEMVCAAREGAQILNLSFGLETLEDQPPIAFEVALEIIDEIAEKEGREILVVAAAGNFGRARLAWPAAFPKVVAVAGLTQNLTAAGWSSRGPWVDCSTMGEGIWSPYVPGHESPFIDPDPEVFEQDDWALWTGTSFAAPQVAGAVAKIAQEQELTPRRALRKLLAGRPALPDYGRVVRILPRT
ncbi:MAG: S8 family peptidase [Pseudonocardiaceae bacterium]